MTVVGSTLLPAVADAAPINVVNTNDSGPGSLRQAITNANSNPGADTIRFRIPGSGVHRIVVSSPLPSIVDDDLTINGYAQPGAAPNTAVNGTNAVLRIVVTDASPHVALGIVIDGAADGTLIKGLVISGFSAGIANNGSDSVIEGNFVGVSPSGRTARRNLAEGINTSGPDGRIGGTEPAARNLLSGNGEFGVESSGTNTHILGNLIGTDRTGTEPLGNGEVGVAIFASNNRIDLGNVISFNGASGVRVTNSTNVGNEIGRNSIFANAGLGINLALAGEGPTPNDGLDGDTGANQLQNYPVLTSARSNPRATTVRGILDSTPSTTFHLRFFASPAGNEGKLFLGNLSVTTDGAGRALFAFRPPSRVTPGQVITSTATAPAGDTSEFSEPEDVRAA